VSYYAYLRLGANRYRGRFGLSFEDLRTGLRIRHRPGIDIAQQDNREDAVDLVNNTQLHFDSHYALLESVVTQIPQCGAGASSI
jgi:itaconyl-CoA hydratase